MLFILKKITEFERNTCCGFILSYMSSTMQKWKREIKQNTDYHFKLQNDTVCTCQPLIVANTGFLHTKYKLFVSF